MLENILNHWKTFLDQFDAESKAVLAKELLKTPIWLFIFIFMEVGFTVCECFVVNHICLF